MHVQIEAVLADLGVGVKPLGAEEALSKGVVEILETRNFKNVTLSGRRMYLLACIWLLRGVQDAFPRLHLRRALEAEIAYFF